MQVDEAEEVTKRGEYIWVARPQIMKLLKVDGAMKSLARKVCTLL